MAPTAATSITALAERPKLDSDGVEETAADVPEGAQAEAPADEAQAAVAGDQQEDPEPDASERSGEVGHALVDGAPGTEDVSRVESAGGIVVGSDDEELAGAETSGTEGAGSEPGPDAVGWAAERSSAPENDTAVCERDGSEPNEPPAGDQETARSESDGAAPPSSEDMVQPQPEIVSDAPRDQVWGQDRPGHEGKSIAALSELIESVTMPTSGTEDQESDMTAVTQPADPTDVQERASGAETTEQWTGATPADRDPDQMEELPSDRPVPADAIKRASEALDAAVNAAPAVLGPASQDDDDESVALVDAEFTHFDRESGTESEPEDVASDYSGRVTDPIPVQSLSAPGVSRETSGSAQMPNGTQQPTGGPHGGDDERRSALIATVPAVDDTTPVAAELAMDARRRIELQGRRFPRPPKTRIITVANQKGGVGKTTTTVNVAAGLAQSGLNVLVIDNDPQGNASTALGIEHRAGTPSVYEILVEGESLASTVQQCPDIPNLWGVPATIDLSGSEIELVSLVSRETRLRKAIDKYLADRIAAGEERIDYVLIDCPPSLGLLTVNAFVAGREVFIPIQCEYYALEGLSQLLKTIDLIRSHLNPELRVSSILLTMYDGRTNLAQQVAGEVRSHFPAETFKTTIPRSVRISEAPSYGQTVMTYDATSTGALAYLQASRELAERGQGGSSPRRAMQAEPVGAQD